MNRTTELLITRRDADMLASLLQAADAGHRDAMEALEDVLDEARIVDLMPTQRVVIGSRVRYLERAAQEPRTVTLALPEHAAPAQGRVSVLSPIGCALLGRAPGDAVQVALPGGRNVELIIVEVMLPLDDEPSAA